MAQCGFAAGATSIRGACLVVPPLFRADSGTNLNKQGENVKGRPCSSVAQLSECSHSKREALGSSPGRATIFSSPCDIWWLSVGSRQGQRASKCACLVVPPLFRTDSGTNLIKQGVNVKGRPCGSVAQLAECSHGKREALDLSPGRATIFSSPATPGLTLTLNS